MMSILALGSMFAAGVGGSLHCMGMCGPILGALTAAVDRPASGRVALSALLLAYHGGRIWTYTVLGFLAGALGDHVGKGVLLGRPLSVVMAALVSLSGAFLLTGLGAERWLRAPRCGGVLAVARPWLRRGAVARFVAGAIMGLIPCGLVYAMLVAVAALRDPWSGALGMTAFGIGTVPALSTAVLGGRLVSPWLRAHGARVVAIGLILIGGWMGLRAASARVAGVQGTSCHVAAPER